MKLHIYSNRHIKNEVINVEKGDYIFLENAFSKSMWKLYFRYNRLNDIENVGHFTFNKDDKRNLHSYMTKAKVKVGKNNYLTQMQHDLQNAFQDPEKILVIAKLLRSDFDISDVIRDTETKVTKKTKDKIERKPKIKSSKSSSGRRKKALYEYFND